MNGLKTWIINISAAVFFITAIEMVLPNNSMKKYGKFVLGLILMTVVINPLFKIINNNGEDIIWNISQNEKNFALMEEGGVNKEEYVKSNIERTLNSFEANLGKRVEGLLKQKYPEKNFKVEVDANYEENNFSIKNINVEVEDKSVKKVKKIDINASKNVDKGATNTSINDEKDIKSYISSELKIKESHIKVYSAEK